MLVVKEATVQDTNIKEPTVFVFGNLGGGEYL